MKKVAFVLVVLAMTSSAFAKVVPSPVNPSYQAQIVQTRFAGQQLFFSYDGGTNYSRVSWFKKQSGQVIDCAWTKSGYLVFWEDNIPIEYRIKQGYKHSFSDPRSIGVFSSSKKVVYWVAGFYANADSWGTDDADNIKVSGNNISYKLTRFTASRYQELRKTIQVPQALANSNRDISPYIAWFGGEIKKIAKKGPELNPSLLALVKQRDRSKLSKIIRENRHYIIRSDVDVGGDPSDLLMINAGPLGVPSGEAGAPEFELDLTCNAKTMLFSFVGKP